MEPTTLTLEIPASDAEELSAMASAHPDDISVVEGHGIDGSEWLTFIVSMTEALAAPLFAYLTVLVAKGKKVIVVRDGERKVLTEQELEKLEAERPDEDERD